MHVCMHILLDVNKKVRAIIIACKLSIKLEHSAYNINQFVIVIVLEKLRSQVLERQEYRKSLNTPDRLVGRLSSCQQSQQVFL